MKLAESGSRGVFWRANVRGSQDRKQPGSVRERGDWWIRWACGHGHLHREHVGPKALAQRESERRRIDRACPRVAPRKTTHLVGDVIRGYLDHVKAVKRSYRDDARYGRVWTDRLGSTPLAEVKAADLERIMKERLATVKPSTVNREFAFLRHLFNIAIRDEKATSNPVTKLMRPKEPSGRVRYLTDEEETRLFAKLTTEAERDRVRFLVHTGLRKSEFTYLRWKDIDLRAAVITIPRSKNGEIRHVPMTSTVKAILTRLARPLDSSEFVFPSNDGNPHFHWAERVLPAYIRAAGIEDFRFHDLRHTFASRLAMEGVDLLSIKELGGWKSLTMVQRYAHLSPAHRRQAIERLVTRNVESDAARLNGVAL